jgi:hypothetical protein
MVPNATTLAAELSGDHIGLIEAHLSSASDQNMVPSREVIDEYLACPNDEDPTLNQLDILKSNCIEIFYNLLMV